MLDNLYAIMALQHLPGFGSARYWRLMDHFQSATNALQQPAHKLNQFLPEPAIQLLSDYQQQGTDSALGRTIAQDMDWLANANNVHLLTLEHHHYPELLRQISRPPALLYVQGDPGTLSLPQIAIVGSRTPTSGGKDNAYYFAQHLAANGFTITSGLALGVDGAAHSGALSVNGKTIAVFGTGIDSIYPSQHQALAQQILEQGGALVSEFPLGTRSQASNFPQRNRLISGLSCGTLVVEAAVRSGSLITARQALHQNREVFAIPGSIHNPLARGCHSLIRQGATLVETGQDIVEQLGGLLELKQEELNSFRSPLSKPQLEPDEDSLLTAIGFDPTPFELVVERSGFAVSKVSAGLMSLELKGAVSTTPIGYIRVD